MALSVVPSTRRRTLAMIICTTVTLTLHYTQAFTSPASLSLSSSHTAQSSSSSSTSSSRLFMVQQQQKQLQQSFTQQIMTKDYDIIRLANFSSNNRNNSVALTLDSAGRAVADALDDSETPLLSETSTATSTKQHNYLSQNIISNLLNEDIVIDGEEDDEDDASKPALGNMHMSESAKLFVSQAVASANNYKKLSSNDDSSTDNRNTPLQQQQQQKATTTRVRASVKETGNDALSSYLKNIANHDLLRHEDEIVLGRQIQILVKYEQQRLLLETTLLRYVSYLFYFINLATFLGHSSHMVFTLFFLHYTINIMQPHRSYFIYI
jgi:hypothetical protein